MYLRHADNQHLQRSQVIIDMISIVLNFHIFLFRNIIHELNMLSIDISIQLKNDLFNSSRTGPDCSAKIRLQTMIADSPDYDY